MKNEEKRCILSVKYSILDTSEGTKQEKTEIERVFIAKSKATLMKKIKDFEARLQKKPRPGFIARKMQYVQHFINSWRYTHKSMLRI
ncbi:hypothetical protein OOZ15_10530 [Galbibacter sp. EGI 63066]|uniref:hypothetical protein n=1 Tax=Galbibacter sp. EGI 63066 TaxID=2993559 RepID=UPI0022491AA7|nr:hypothetical protein [Galbibacter sp. EGI 63066]MCX2680377.1 hypothetical protein [Galbibacter sp. EGI 63066]